MDVFRSVFFSTVAVVVACVVGRAIVADWLVGDFEVEGEEDLWD